MTWNNITVEQYSKLYPTLKTDGMTDDEIVQNTILQVSIIKGITEEEAEFTTIEETKKIQAFLRTELPTKIHRFWKCNGVRYEFNISAERITCGGYIGIMNSIKEDPIKNLHMNLFNMCKPVKLRLNGWKPYEFKQYEVSERIEDFKQMPISVAYPIAFFFLSLSKALIKDTPDYLSKQMMKMKKKLNEIEVDLVSGVGQ